jgi:hypothetical protein
LRAARTGTLGGGSHEAFRDVVSAIVLLPATGASADPIAARQILGGQFITPGETGLGQFSLFGAGFNLQGRVQITQFGCEPCTPGQTQSLTRVGEVRDLSGTVDGVTYPKLFVAGSVGIPSHLSVEGGFFVPVDAVNGTQISFPFRTFAPDLVFLNEFVGYLTPFIDSDTQPAFSFPVTGSGTAVVTLGVFRLADGTPFISAGNIDWTFKSSVSATPEPTSVMLVGTGLAALVATRIRRRRRAVKPMS